MSLKVQDKVIFIGNEKLLETEGYCRKKIYTILRKEFNFYEIKKSTHYWLEEEDLSLVIRNTKLSRKIYKSHKILNEKWLVVL